MNNFGRPSFNSNNTPQYKNNSEFTNFAKLGHKTVEQVKEEMNNVKYNNFKSIQDSRKTEVKSQPNNDFNRVPDYKGRVDNLRNIYKG